MVLAAPDLVWLKICRRLFFVEGKPERRATILLRFRTGSPEWDRSVSIPFCRAKQNRMSDLSAGQSPVFGQTCRFPFPGTVCRNEDLHTCHLRMDGDLYGQKAVGGIPSSGSFSFGLSWIQVWIHLLFLTYPADFWSKPYTDLPALTAEFS